MNQNKVELEKGAHRAECEIAKYAADLSVKTDEELQAIVERERNCRGWTSQRSYFLAALRQECERRHIKYCW